MALPRPIPPKWASEDQQSDVSGQYNVVQPPDEREMSGWLLGEKPNRQWMNWLFRQNWLFLLYLESQSTTVSTNSSGVGLFPLNNALITIDAVDKNNVANYFRAVGFKETGSEPTWVAGSIQSNGISLLPGTVGGNQPLDGGGGSNLIIRGTSTITS